MNIMNRSEMLGIGVALSMVGNAAPAVAAEIRDPSAANRAQQAHTIGEQAGPLAVAASVPDNLRANAASASSEGQSGNDIVCTKPGESEAIPSKKELIRLAGGGKDACGRTVNKIWTAMGVTPEVARTMKLGQVCASEGYISSGRKVSPVPANNKGLVINGKRVAYTRPLSDFGSDECYEAYKGEREDGTKLAVLTGCGNPEAEKLPPKRDRKIPKQPTASVNVQKIAKDDQNNKITVTDKIFTVAATCFGKGNKTIQNTIKIGTETASLLKGCLPSKARGRLRYAIVTEFNVPDGYEIESPASGTQRVYLPRLVKKGRGFKALTAKLATFTNKKKVIPPGPPPMPQCVPPTTGTYPACEAPKGAEPPTTVTPVVSETPKGTEPGSETAPDPNATLPECNEYTVGIPCTTKPV